MTLINENSKGVYVIGATPFRDDLSLDVDGIGKLTEHYIEHGATGFTVLGMMGEAPKLSTSESRTVVEGYIKAARDLPVVVGVSAAGFSAMSELTKSVMDMGAAGVMIAPPNTLRTDDQIISYYQMAGETLGKDVPIVLQDFPLSTSVQISVGALKKIIETVPSIKMLKHEDWPGLAKILALRAAEAAGQRRISILCGNAGVFLAEEMERGADGAMTGFAYIEMMRDVVKYAGAGDMDRAMDIFDAYLPLVRYEQQPGLGLAVRKYVLKKRGAIASDAIRRPGPKLSPADIVDVERLIARQTKRLEEIA
jgi:Dihydrodipicolinate synthase/N-acetylneuraminate lyase